MVACEFGPDQAHVFVGNGKNYAVPTSSRLKGAFAHRIRHVLWERMKGKLWGDSFWSDGYFYRAIGSTTSEAVQYYIEHSQRKHWEAPDYEQARMEEEQGKQTSLSDFA